MTTVRAAGPDDAEAVCTLIHTVFADRPVLDPPSTALDDTVDGVRSELAAHGGLLATHDDRPVGSMLFRPHGRWLGVRRVGVLPEARQHGVAHLLADAAVVVAEERRFTGLVLEARAELPETVRFWMRNNYVEVDRDGPRLRMVRQLPLRLTLPTAASTRQLGQRLGAILEPGDLVMLTGDLGAGKTTLTQGIGEGMRVDGAVTSPTFVISRVHRSGVDGPALVHVDAYRLDDRAELDDLDLDTDLDEAVTVVEWGSGLAEVLSSSRLEIRLDRRTDDEVRDCAITAAGPRWFDVDLAGLLA